MRRNAVPISASDLVAFLVREEAKRSPSARFMLKICLQLGIAARAEHADQALDRPSSAILRREAFNQVSDSGKRLIEAEELAGGGEGNLPHVVLYRRSFCSGGAASACPSRPILASRYISQQIRSACAVVLLCSTNQALQLSTGREYMQTRKGLTALRFLPVESRSGRLRVMRADGKKNSNTKTLTGLAESQKMIRRGSNQFAGGRRLSMKSVGRSPTAARGASRMREDTR